jgi:hypothetical protein
MEGSRVVLISSSLDKTWQDHLATRTGGDMSIRKSTDGGKTYSAPFKFTNDERCLRLGVAFSGDNIHVVWMNWRPDASLPKGTWDVKHIESADFGNTWSQQTTVIAGVFGTGAGRPSVRLDQDGNVHVIAMVEKSGKAACLIEGNRTLNPCTEVYYARRVNGVWSGRHVTDSPHYCGRPELVVSGNLIVSALDVRVQSAGFDNDVAIIVSRDGGDTFGPLQFLRQGVGEATHPVIARHSSGVLACAWNETVSGVMHNFIRFSTDDAVTWTPVEQISEVESSTPTISFSDNYLHVIAGKRSGNGMTHRRFGPVA